MRKALAIAAVASLAIVPATGAAGSKRGPTLRSLQAQITSLKKQVNTLKKRTTLAENIAVVALAYGGCSTAVTADTFQDAFVGVDGHFTHTTGTNYFGAQSALNDYGACGALEITRAHNQNPPTTAVLAALLDLFKPASTSATSFMSVPRSTGFVFSQLFVTP
jgi:hypothetical protein